MRTPVYVTFFEQHEATTTAELLTEGPDGAFQAFAPSQLSIKTCNDKVRTDACSCFAQQAVASVRLRELATILL